MLLDWLGGGELLNSDFAFAVPRPFPFDACFLEVVLALFLGVSSSLSTPEDNSSDSLADAENSEELPSSSSGLKSSPESSLLSEGITNLLLFGRLDSSSSSFLDVLFLVARFAAFLFSLLLGVVFLFSLFEFSLPPLSPFSLGSFFDLPGSSSRFDALVDLLLLALGDVK